MSKKEPNIKKAKQKLGNEDMIHIDDLLSVSNNQQPTSRYNHNHNHNQKIIAFWRPSDPHGYLGQWYASNFKLTADICENFPEKIKNLSLYKERPDVLDKLTDHSFNTAEKFMMMGKAALFLDNDVLNAISETDSPVRQRSLGRLVKNFDEAEWNKYCRDIVKIGNYLKFTQDESLRNNLVMTRGNVLAEGSPLDKIWGIGIKYDNPRVQDISEWKGKNYLGECLMFVRDLLMEKTKHKKNLSK